jgi:riboflavin biosynthesis pyrimidine reductase
VTIDYRVLFDSETPGRHIDSDELADLYRHPTVPDRPWVRTNFVSTLDGAAQGPDGRSGSINTASDRLAFALQRTMADVIVVGAATARIEQYRAVDLEPWQQAMRAELGLAPYPTLAVVSRTAAAADDLASLPDAEGGPVLIITGRAQARTPIPDGVELITLDDQDLVPPKKLISALADRGFQRVLCEGGPSLVHALHANGLVDEICLTLSPMVIGGPAKRTTSGTLLDPEQYRLAHCITAEDQALLLRYLRR